jgi:hypothetical protein
MRWIGARERTEEAADAIVDWRFDRLRRAGLASELARRIAIDGRYDIHQLLELVDQGCPAGLAARILAPIGGAGGAR